MRPGLIKISFVILFIALGISLKAQYKFGILGGIGSSNYHGKDFSSDNQPKLGPALGLFYEYEFNPTLSIGTQANYEKKGTWYNDYPRVATSIICDSRLEYITVPIYLKLNIDYKAFFSIYAGVSGSYLLNSTKSVDVTEYGYIITPETFFDYDFRKWDAGILAGFNINYRGIFFDMSYNYGVIDIYKGNNVPSIKNLFITTKLGITIYHKKVQHCLNPYKKRKGI
jgi:hypothetical protein